MKSNSKATKRKNLEKIKTKASQETKIEKNEKHPSKNSTKNDDKL